MAEEKINSEITGTVWKIERAIGDALDEEDVIMILESMKMEIPVLAPRSGTLTAVHVEEGANITEGQLVATMES